MTLSTLDYLGAVIETPWEQSEELREKRWWRIQREERRDRRKQAEAVLVTLSHMDQPHIILAAYQQPVLD